MCWTLGRTDRPEVLAARGVRVQVNLHTSITAISGAREARGGKCAIRAFGLRVSRVVGHSVPAERYISLRIACGKIDFSADRRRIGGDAPAVPDSAHRHGRFAA